MPPLLAGVCSRGTAAIRKSGTVPPLPTVVCFEKSSRHWEIWYCAISTHRCLFERSGAIRKSGNVPSPLAGVYSRGAAAIRKSGTVPPLPAGVYSRGASAIRKSGTVPTLLAGIYSRGEAAIRKSGTVPSLLAGVCLRGAAPSGNLP